VSNNINTSQITLQSGFGHWTGTAPQGGFLAAQNIGQSSFQVSLSNGCMFPENVLLHFITHLTCSSCARTTSLTSALWRFYQY
jgi:hypothetical protein